MHVDNECDFSRYLKHLRGQVGVQEYMESDLFKLHAKLPIDQAQCDHHAGWRNFSLMEMGKEPHICSAHLTGKFYFIALRIDRDTPVSVQALPPTTIPKLITLTIRIAEKITTISMSRWCKSKILRSFPSPRPRSDSWSFISARLWGSRVPQLGLKGHGLVSIGAGPWRMLDMPGATTTWVRRLIGVT